MIKKYIKYVLNEKVDEYIIQIMDFIRPLINIEEKEIFLDLKKKFGISFSILVKKESIDKFPLYNSNISIKEILDKKFEDFKIEFFVKDDTINKNKFLSILSHELTHVYQLLNDPENKYFDSFNKMINIEDLKNKSLEYKYDFLDYIYYNFLHELDARVNQAYESYLFKKKNSFEELWDLFKNDSELYKMLLFINDFNHQELIKRWDRNELFILTNQFNILYEIDEIDINEIENYYQKWETVFMENSTKYIEETKNAIEQAFYDKKRYTENETKTYCYDETPLHRKRINIDKEILLLVNKFKKINQKNEKNL